MAAMQDSWKALVASRSAEGYRVEFKDQRHADLEAGEVLIEVTYSSLNYKDGLAITGRGKIVRRFPMVLGIDLAGTVLESSSPAFVPGDSVLGLGQGFGEQEWGGYSRYQRVNAAWISKIPAPFDPETAMAIGTAGFTAILCVLGLEHLGVLPDDREVVVTGAAGGVGSFAVMLLGVLGYKVVASTGRASSHGFLKALGASRFLDRAELATKGSAMGPQRWAGGVDTVGGQTLATLLAETCYDGAIAACGMASGANLDVSVFPFILRNVTLLGTSSSQTREPRRSQAWERLARDISLPTLAKMYRVEPLSHAIGLGEAIVAGKVQGRVVVDVTR